MPERDWLYEAIETLRTDQREALAQLRLDMNRGFDQLRDEMQVQNGRVRRSEERLTVMETRQSEEDKQAMKTGAWTALIASVGLTGVIEIFKSWIRP